MSFFSPPKFDPFLHLPLNIKLEGVKSISTGGPDSDLRHFWGRTGAPQTTPAIFRAQ
jgi:hypothetical protein